MSRAAATLKRRLGAILGRAYPSLYGVLCGVHPNLRPWHFQWLSGRALYEPLRDVLGEVEGDVLDVGCGAQPYRGWMPRAERYVGIDVADGPGVDVVIVPGQTWAVDSAAFDVLLCTQVLEHVADLEHTLSELRRVVRPGGRLVVAVPFAYNEHGTPHDYWRVSRHGVRLLLERDAEVERVIRQGGVGTLICVSLLNWLEVTVAASGPLAFLRLAVLPVWIAFCAFVNGIGALLDRVDASGLFYINVLVVARRHAG
jgi:SAM-dependent methyltransferase